MMRAWQESVATDKVLLDKVLGKAVGGCKTARLCLFSICNSDWVVIGDWMGRGGHRCISSREKKYTWGTVTVVWKGRSSPNCRAGGDRIEASTVGI